MNPFLLIQYCLQLLIFYWINCLKSEIVSMTILCVFDSKHISSYRHAIDITTHTAFKMENGFFLFSKKMEQIFASTPSIESYICDSSQTNINRFRRTVYVLDKKTVESHLKPKMPNNIIFGYPLIQYHLRRRRHCYTFWLRSQTMTY